MNSHHTPTNSSEYFFTEHPALMLPFKISDLQIQIIIKFDVVKSINTYLKKFNHITRIGTINTYLLTLPNQIIFIC